MSLWRGLALPLALVLLAEAAWRIAEPASDSLAPPSAILAALARSLADGSLLASTGATLQTVLLGAAIGAGLGVPAGAALGLFPRADRLLEVPVEALRPIPSVALIPLALLVFGFGIGMEAAITAFACFWPTLILCRQAARGVEPRLDEVARLLSLSGPARLLKIVLPAILPRVVTALRLALGIALVVAVTVEITANPRGLGHALMSAQQTLHPDQMFACLVWIGLLGLVLNQGLVLLERRLVGRRG